MRLPVADAEVAAERVSWPAARGTPAGTVLVVDDDPSVRNLLGRFLSREGYQVETAPDGATGLRLARERRPDVITLDVLMPDMDGWAVLSALKADPELATIPVVMLSVVDDKPTAFALGVAEYLTKPIDRAGLAAVLRRYTPAGSSRLRADRRGRRGGAARAAPRVESGRDGWWPRPPTDASPSSSWPSTRPISCCSI